ncbi:MAG: hypothetical protein ACPL1F_07330, partial [bacterium]
MSELKKNKLIFSFLFLVLIILIFLFIVFNKKEKIDINYTKIFYTIKNDNVEDFKEIYHKYGNNIYKIKNKNNQNIIHLICLNNSVNILKEVIDKTEKKYLIEYDNLGN